MGGFCTEFCENSFIWSILAIACIVECNNSAFTTRPMNLLPPVPGPGHTSPKPSRTSHLSPRRIC